MRAFSLRPDVSLANSASKDAVAAKSPDKCRFGCQACQRVAGVLSWDRCTVILRFVAMISELRFNVCSGLMLRVCCANMLDGYVFLAVFRPSGGKD